MFFKRACFARPPLYTFGNEGRNLVIDYPNASFGTGQFGTIRGTSEPSRHIQFGMKLVS
jgi:hypothetical protein